MAVRLTNQPERLSYTRRDLDLIDAEVEEFIKVFIPTIRNTGRANVGRLFLRILEALVDKLNYSQDMRFRQSVLRTVTELQSAIDIAELVRYKPEATSTAGADLTATTLTGPAPAGGIPIPQYSVFLTGTAPIKQFVALEASLIPEGASSFYPLPVIQGIRVVDQTIKASADGDPDEVIRFPVARTPHIYIEIKVDGVQYSQRSDLKDSEFNDRHYYLTEDEDDFTSAHFGDGTYGAKLTPGAVVTATYIQSLGEDGNTPAGKISKVQGSLSALIAVTNEEAATGGSNGDIVEDIVRKAPKIASAARGEELEGTFFRASHPRDFEALAELVSGVFQALSSTGDGAAITVYIMPDGGGIAPSALLTETSEFLETRKIHGARVNVLPLQSAHILLQMNVLLLTDKVNKSIARKRIFETIAAFKLNGDVNQDGALYFRNLKIGRGFALSDVSALLENIDDGDLIDFVDYIKFTRYPTPVAGNGSTTVEFNGEIVPNNDAGYADWTVSYLTGTTFAVFKNGVKDSEGTVGVRHTTNDGSLTFTLGATTDTLVAADTWTFSSSAYRNNMKLSKFEFMELVRDSDLDITVYYPGELEIGE